MAKETPLHAGETLTEDAPYVGDEWVVNSKHHGHSLWVRGAVVRDGQTLAIYVVECSCGEQFRMSSISIQRGQENQGSPENVYEAPPRQRRR